MSSAGRQSKHFVDAWVVDLDRQYSGRPQRVITEQEQQRAARFRSKSLALRWTNAREALRNILASYLTVPAQSLCFDEAEKGKPFIKNLPANSSLFFNLSHSNRRALVAVTNQQEIGADIELVKSFVDMDQVVSRFFCTAEKMALDKLSPSERATGFYYLWTRKEAILKATGKGLSLPLNRYHVSCDDNAQLIDVNGDLDEAKRWQLSSRRLTDDYVCAIAMRGSSLEVQWIDY